MNRIGLALAGALIVLFLPLSVAAHCDTMEGPVIKAAQSALATGDVDKVLIWVQPGDEQEVRAAFKEARSGSMTEREFFELLVRVHRAGEGAPYTGIKDSMDAAEAHYVNAADAAIAAGDDTALRSHVLMVVEEGLADRFNEVESRKDYKTVAEGQEYVAAYVVYQHYVEGLVAAAEGANGHGAEGAHAAHDAATHAGDSPEEHLAHESVHAWWRFWE